MAIFNSESQWKTGEFLKRQALQEVGSFEVGMHGDPENCRPTIPKS